MNLNIKSNKKVYKYNKFFILLFDRILSTEGNFAKASLFFNPIPPIILLFYLL